MHRCHPAVSGQQSVQCAMEGFFGPAGGSGEADALAYRVDAGIGPTGGVDRHVASEDAFDDPLEFSLNRTAGRLTLPSDKAGAVVVKRGEEGPAHRRNLAEAQTRSKPATACQN